MRSRSRSYSPKPGADNPRLAAVRGGRDRSVSYDADAGYSPERRHMEDGPGGRATLLRTSHSPRERSKLRKQSFGSLQRESALDTPSTRGGGHNSSTSSMDRVSRPSLPASATTNESEWPDEPPKDRRTPLLQRRSFIVAGAGSGVGAGASKPAPRESRPSRHTPSPTTSVSTQRRSGAASSIAPMAVAPSKPKPQPPSKPASKAGPSFSFGAMASAAGSVPLWKQKPSLGTLLGKVAPKPKPASVID